MPDLFRRKRLALLALLALPVVAFGVGFGVLRDGGGPESQLRADGTARSQHEDGDRAAPTSTEPTTTLPPTTTTEALRLGPSSPLPPVPRPGEPVAAST